MRVQDGNGRVVGAVVRDVLTGKEQAVYALTVINAAGPFADEVRHLSEVGWMVKGFEVGWQHLL